MIEAKFGKFSKCNKTNKNFNAKLNLELVGIKHADFINWYHISIKNVIIGCLLELHTELG